MHGLNTLMRDIGSYRRAKYTPSIRDCKGIWISWPTGTWKTTGALELFETHGGLSLGDIYYKNPWNMWWCGYTN